MARWLPKVVVDRWTRAQAPLFCLHGVVMPAWRCAACMPAGQLCCGVHSTHLFDFKSTRSII
eukprot:349775-Chlamydomonas_euryale.AAC.3